MHWIWPSTAAAALQAFLDEAETDPQYWGLMNFGDTPMAQGGYGHKGVAYVDQEYDLAHTLYQLYLRSGDRRALEKARGIGDVAARLGQTADFGDKRAVFQVAERNLGWPLLTLMRGYEATRDERYRQAADRIVSYANHYAIDPPAELRHGTWWRSWMIDGSKVFMIGLLHEGLDKHHQLTGAADTKRSILTSLDWMIEHMWRQDIETFMYEFNAYNPGHRDVWPTDLNLMVVHAFGYGYRISGDPRYLDIGLRALRSAVARMPAAAKHGKEFAMQFRTNLEMVGQLYGARGRFAWPPPPTSGEAPARPPGPPSPCRPMSWPGPGRGLEAQGAHLQDRSGIDARVREHAQGAFPDPELGYLPAEAPCRVGVAQTDPHRHRRNRRRSRVRPAGNDDALALPARCKRDRPVGRGRMSAPCGVLEVSAQKQLQDQAGTLDGHGGNLLRLSATGRMGQQSAEQCHRGPPQSPAPDPAGPDTGRRCSTWQ